MSRGSSAEKKLLGLQRRFIKARSAKIRISGNELMALPDPGARKFLKQVALGKITKARRPHRETALLVLGLRGSYNAIPPLLQALKAPDQRIRDAALLGLSEVRLRKGATGILKQKRTWARSTNLDKIALALLRSDPDGAQVQAWFRVQLTSKRPQDRIAVLQSLLLLDHPSKVWHKLVELAAETKHRKVQDMAARVLAAFESRK